MTIRGQTAVADRVARLVHPGHFEVLPGHAQEGSRSTADLKEPATILMQQHVLQSQLVPLRVILRSVEDTLVVLAIIGLADETHPAPPCFWIMLLKPPLRSPIKDQPASVAHAVGEIGMALGCEGVWMRLSG